jgi:hypothetical protein
MACETIIGEAARPMSLPQKKRACSMSPKKHLQFAPGRLRSPSSLLAAAALTCAFLSHARAAQAALGGDAASIDRDRIALKSERTIALNSNYQVHELTTPEGSVVREYLAAGDRVCAVSWQGTRAPNLRQLLGDYFARYSSEAHAHRRGLHSLSIDTPDFAAFVIRWQHGFRGRVILPALLPAGVSREELR